MAIASSFTTGAPIAKIGDLPPDLAHPQPIRGGGDAGHPHPARGQVREKQNDEALQPSPSPHFRGEEIGGRDQLPVPREKLLPGGLPAPFRGWLDPVSFENVANSQK